MLNKSALRNAINKIDLQKPIVPDDISAMLSPLLFDQADNPEFYEAGEIDDVDLLRCVLATFMAMQRTRDDCVTRLDDNAVEKDDEEIKHMKQFIQDMKITLLLITCHICGILTDIQRHSREQGELHKHDEVGCDKYKH